MFSITKAKVLKERDKCYSILCFPIGNVSSEPQLAVSCQSQKGIMHNALDLIKKRAKG